MSLLIPVISDSLLKKNVFIVKFSKIKYKKYLRVLSHCGRLPSKLVFQDCGFECLMFVVGYHSLDQAKKLLEKLDPTANIKLIDLDIDQDGFIIKNTKFSPFENTKFSPFVQKRRIIYGREII